MTLTPIDNVNVDWIPYDIQRWATFSLKISFQQNVHFNTKHFHYLRVFVNAVAVHDDLAKQD